MRSTLSVLALTLSLMAPSAARASDSATRIFQAPTGFWEATKSQRFGFNPELGRAWVEIDFHYRVSEASETHRVRLPGLAYDPERSEIVFDANGKRVVCAKVEPRGRWLFKHHHVEPTGACELTQRYVNVPVDNGFAIDQIEHFEVHFSPEAPAEHAG
jgi:hypothetical protein